MATGRSCKYESNGILDTHLTKFFQNGTASEALIWRGGVSAFEVDDDFFFLNWRGGFQNFHPQPRDWDGDIKMIDLINDSYKCRLFFFLFSDMNDE